MASVSFHNVYTRQTVEERTTVNLEEFSRVVLCVQAIQMEHKMQPEAGVSQGRPRLSLGNAYPVENRRKVRSSGLELAKL
jgi:hypothetical protein